MVREGVYYRPPTFNSATGEVTASEVSAACKFVGAHIQSAGYLGLAPVVPGTERLIVRSSELTSIASPRKGD